MDMGEQINISIDLKRLIGLDKVAAMLDISVREVQRRIAANDLPRPVKIGRLSKLPMEEVLGYIDRLKRQRNGNH